MSDTSEFYGRVRALLQEGVLGDLLEVSATYAESEEALDLLRWLTGQEIAVAFARPAGFVATLTGGATFEARGGPGCSWVFAGDQGWLAVDEDTRTWTLARGPGAPRTHSFEPA